MIWFWFSVGGENLRSSILQPPKRQKTKTLIKRSDILGHVKAGSKLLHDAEEQKKQEEEMVQSLGDYTIVDLQSKILEMTVSFLVLKIFNAGACLTFKSIFHKALNLFQFDCEITLESVPGTNQY